MHLGASTVKLTIVDPCIRLSESDSKQYTDFEFCLGKNQALSLKSSTTLSNLRWKKNLKESLHILEHGESGDIEQVIVKIL